MLLFVVLGFIILIWLAITFLDSCLRVSRVLYNLIYISLNFALIY